MGNDVWTHGDGEWVDGENQLCHEDERAGDNEVFYRVTWRELQMIRENCAYPLWVECANCEFRVNDNDVDVCLYCPAQIDLMKMIYETRRC